MRITFADYLDQQACEARLRNLGRPVPVSAVMAIQRLRREARDLRSGRYPIEPEAALRRLKQAEG